MTDQIKQTLGDLRFLWGAVVSIVIGIFWLSQQINRVDEIQRRFNDHVARGERIVESVEGRIGRLEGGQRATEISLARIDARTLAVLDQLGEIKVSLRAMAKGRE